MKANSICRVCGTSLDGENWNLSSMKNNTPVCKQCERDRSIQHTRKRGVKPVHENKKCSAYLGVYIAETLLSNIFKDVQRMENGNEGFDFVCNSGAKIDVKSSATWDKGNRWSFHINKNNMADYFLCIAFDNREDLNPIYLWLLPGNIVNGFTTLVVRKSDISKWEHYELLMDNVISCCDKMKHPFREAARAK